ncbi:protein FAM185A [Patella vulgata]|uniref:protein FAM185A n=1 Tax=Patella vulgata TaxID=6465 RepID=UPI00217F2BB5|nr:protein FAM185A [Patella vulgata]
MSSMNNLWGSFCRLKCLNNYHKLSRIWCSTWISHPQNNQIYGIQSRKMSKTCFSNQNKLSDNKAFSLSKIVNFSTRTCKEDLVEAWFYEVKTFGKIDIKVPFDLEVEPLHPLEYPNMNKFIIEIFNTSASKDKIGSFNKLYNLNIDVDDEKEIVKVKADVSDGVQLPLICNIKIPIKFNVNIESEDKDVTIKKFEADEIKIKTITGNCNLQKLKCGSIDVVSNGGNIISESLLQGNIQLSTTGTGEITGDRFQGQTIQCCNEKGDVDIKTIYADKTLISTQSGDIHIGSCHGNSTVEIKTGDLSIDTLDGDIKTSIEDGDVDIYIARCGHVDINTTKGDIQVKLSETVTADVNLQAESIDISQDINYTGQPEKTTNDQIQHSGNINGGDSGCKISVTSKQGKITLTQQDWFSTLKLSS